jgi:hypothetical protein
LFLLDDDTVAHRLAHSPGDATRVNELLANTSDGYFAEYVITLDAGRPRAPRRLPSGIRRPTR